MQFHRFIFRELSQPSGHLARFIIAPLWNHRNRVLNDLALGQLGLHSDDRVLEVGCGGGYQLGRLVHLLQNGNLIGLDASEAMTSFCSRQYRDLVGEGRMGVVCGRAGNLPFPDRTFSRVCSINSIFYWEQPESGLREIRRVMEPYGRFVLCLTEKASLEKREFSKHGLHLFDQNEVTTILQQVGFRIVDVHNDADRYRRFMCLTCTP